MNTTTATYTQLEAGTYEGTITIDTVTYAVRIHRWGHEDWGYFIRSADEVPSPILDSNHADRGCGTLRQAKLQAERHAAFMVKWGVKP